jgi:hypothetical protein
MGPGLRRDDSWKFIGESAASSSRRSYATVLPSAGAAINLSAITFPHSRAMIRIIERLFETVEVNAACAVLSVVASLAMTGCLRLLWE